MLLRFCILQNNILKILRKHRLYLDLKNRLFGKVCLEYQNDAMSQMALHDFYDILEILYDRNQPLPG